MNQLIEWGKQNPVPVGLAFLVFTMIVLLLTQGMDIIQKLIPERRPKTAPEPKPERAPEPEAAPKRQRRE